MLEFWIFFDGAWCMGRNDMLAIIPSRQRTCKSIMAGNITYLKSCPTWKSQKWFDLLKRHHGQHPNHIGTARTLDRKKSELALEGSNAINRTTAVIPQSKLICIALIWTVVCLSIKCVFSSCQAKGGMWLRRRGDRYIYIKIVIKIYI